MSLITAKQIQRLLAQKHAEDVYVAECKNGPSQTWSHVRLDGWAMKRSWSSACTIGYEIKVSRGDWLGDSKWPAYLGLCNQLNFVCPQGIISPSELPETCGLLLVTANGEGLRTVKKAPWRKVDHPESLWRYILMCRAKITRDTWDDEPSVERWKQWLSDYEEKRRIGYSVSQKLAQHVDAVERENAELRKRIEAYDAVRQRMKELGIEDSQWTSAAYVDLRYKVLTEIMPSWLDRSLERVITAAQSVRSAIAEEKRKLLPKEAA